MNFHNYTYFLVGIVIPTYKIIEWISTSFGKVLKKLFIRGERGAVIWFHHVQHSRRSGHQAKTAIECTDDKCVAI